MAFLPAIAAAAAGDVIDLKHLLDEMVDRSRIAEFPQPEFVCKQANHLTKLLRAIEAGLKIGPIP